MAKDFIDVLIVDDQLGVRSLLATALGDAGYSVATASNGDEGVKMTRKLKPKLVIMDIKMPVKDGITALYEIKEFYPEVLVLIMSAYGERETIDKIKKAGAVYFISKPFDIYFLLDYVNKLLCGNNMENYA